MDTLVGIACLGQLRWVVARLVSQLADLTSRCVVVKQFLVALVDMFVDYREVSIHLPERVKNSCAKGLILQGHN